MFTGIIEAVGKVKAVPAGGLEISIPAAWKLADGESLAVNGACLTVAGSGPGRAVFSVSPETASKTTLRLLKAGSPVNLERALAAGARLGGHFVTGHVDGAARLIAARKAGNSVVIEVEKTAGALLVEKGSVALDGISLTVYGISAVSFKAAIIPHTWENTALRTLKPGGLLNIEYDILGKYAAKAASPGITREFLKENGFF
ncbi:MAG: riboflavin synthase [Elusimicrobia bacterium]|nr:riboflavin synthase [Elusimicrobiota bacterium]